jgi:hypothetical protein
VPPEDFFDEEWEEPSRTHDTAATRPQEGTGATRPTRASRVPRPPRPPRLPRGPRRPREGGPTPQWGRLAVLAAGVVVFLLVIVFLARSCGGGGAQSANEDYFGDVKKVVVASDAAGKSLHDLLRSRPRPLKSVQARLHAILDQTTEASSSAAGLDPPKQVEQYQPALQIAMAYRVNGVKCLLAQMPAAWVKRRAGRIGRRLVPCTQKLVASDVLYADSFAQPSTSALNDAGLSVQVPTSAFIQPGDDDLLTPAGVGVAVKGLHPRVARSGLHGLSLDSVVVQPGGASLHSGGAVNQVKVSDNLAFVVTATNGGNFQEVQVPVRITLKRGSSVIRGSATIERIEAKQTARVTVSGIISASNAPKFSQPYKMTVLVVPVPGERTADNNTATYTVVFTL